ncbi:hypothetical protein GJ496_000465 [Pomphorhynchus laevis]|nr:hypothetical protein GJ496_000465 [Pomphorhynchus laevis]
MKAFDIKRTLEQAEVHAECYSRPDINDSYLTVSLCETNEGQKIRIMKNTEHVHVSSSTSRLIRQFDLNINAINNACALVLQEDVEASIALTRYALFEVLHSPSEELEIITIPISYISYEDDLDPLNAPFTANEIYEALLTMKDRKASDPDDLCALIQSDQSPTYNGNMTDMIQNILSYLENRDELQNDVLIRSAKCLMDISRTAMRNYTTTNSTQNERIFNFPKKSSNGYSIPSWLMPRPALL